MLFDLDYRKGGGRIGILGSGKADQGYGVPIGVQFFGAFGSEVTSYEQRHPDIYQDKFKRQITLVDTEDAKDSGKGKRWMSQNGLREQIQCLANE
jgi:hypothetical protein